LTDDQTTFLRLFVQRRGNLSEMEKALGISYPTVRNKLEEIIRALAQPEESGAQEPSRLREAILQQVATGTLAAAEALRQLSELGNAAASS